MNVLTYLCASALLLCTGLVAQTDDAAKAPQPKADKLKKALSTMASLPSLAFATSTSTVADNPFMRRAGRAPKPSESAANGVVSGDILCVNLNDDADQVVIRGRRMIAKNDSEDWALRRGKLANGSTLPFVLDPQLFFSMLSQLPLKVMHKQVGTANNKPVETYTFSVEGEAAQNLLWAGAIPEAGAGSSIGGMGVVMIAGGGGAFAGRPAKSKVTIDVAVSLDPATSLVHAVKVRTYSKGNAFPARMVVRGGLEEGEEEEEKEKEEEEFDPENPKFKNGLPVRKKKDMTFMKFDIELTKHNSAVLPDLDARARALLNLPR